MIKTNLAVLMAERGLKIADVYEATGISKTTLMAISENTGKGIQYETIDKLCNFLGVSPKEFFVYAPYIFKYTTEKGENELDHISITVDRASNLKSYELYSIFETPEAENYPVTKNDADLIVYTRPSYDGTNSDNWNKSRKEFYKIYDSLPISLKSDVNNHIYSLVLNNLSRLNGVTLTTMDGPIGNNGNDLFHELEIKTGMNVIINIFDGRFTRKTKIPLFVVNDDKQ